MDTALPKTLREIENALSLAEEEIRAAGDLGLDTEEFGKYIETLVDKKLQKIENIDSFLDSLEIKQAEATTIASAFGKMKDRANTRAKTIYNLKRSILKYMRDTGTITTEKSVKTTLHTYYISTYERLKKEPDAITPKEYQKTETIVSDDDDKIKADLSRGVSIPGFSLVKDMIPVRR